MSQDPKANIIWQWMSLGRVLGNLSKEFQQLSEYPPLGKWTIVTSINVTPIKFERTIPTYFCLKTHRVAIISSLKFFRMMLATFHLDNSTNHCSQIALGFECVFCLEMFSSLGRIDTNTNYELVLFKIVYCETCLL